MTVIKKKEGSILKFYLLLIVILSSCNLNTKPKAANFSKLNDEYFNAFYKKFHEDSLFQISRVKFPLPGINTDDMTVEDSTYYWKKGDWAMQHLLDTTVFLRKNKISDTVVLEEITSKDPGVIINRNFKKLGGKWFLVRYEDVNL